MDSTICSAVKPVSSRCDDPDCLKSLAISGSCCRESANAGCAQASMIGYARSCFIADLSYPGIRPLPELPQAYLLAANRFVLKRRSEPLNPQVRSSMLRIDHPLLAVFCSCNTAPYRAKC